MFLRESAVALNYHRWAAFSGHGSSGARERTAFLQLEILERRILPSVNAHLLRLNPNTIGSSPAEFTRVNGQTFFSADDGVNGPKLWVSDGTPAGTFPILAPFNGTPFNLTSFNGALLFGKENVADGQLWRSNGTVAGTTEVKDLGGGVDTFHGYVFPYPFDPEFLTNVNGTLFFSTDSKFGDLWRTDGTPAGTSRIFDSPTGPLTNVNGTLFFQAYDGTQGTALWATDGTFAGTRIVKDIGATGASRDIESANVNGTLFFVASDISHGNELWRSDGTAAGTFQVRDISDRAYPQGLTNVTGTLFFSADDGANGRQLWASNGAAAGTVMLTSINPNETSSPTGCSPYSLTNVRGTLFFSANTGTHGRELWRSNGTVAGTVLVKDVNVPAPPDAYLGSTNGPYLINFNGTLLFSGDDGTHGNELWSSSGTAAGTIMVQDIDPGSNGSNPGHLANNGGTLFFSADDGAHGTEPWRSNGTASGTLLVKDINTKTPTSNAQGFVDFDGTAFFSADDGEHGQELWTTNATAIGTTLMRDIAPGNAGSNPSGMVNANGTLFFAANDGIHGTELWRSDGAAAGSSLVADITSVGPYSTKGSYPDDLTNLNGTVFFSADDGTHGRELWESNGTSAGTMIVNAPFPFGDPEYLTNVNGTLFFGGHYFGLWRTDGTAAGTVNLAPTFGRLTNVNGTLFFDGFDSTHGAELWESNGTAAGTFMVRDINPGPRASSEPSDLVNVNGTLFFAATDGTHGDQLWTSDGTYAGTRMVENLGRYPNLRNLTNVHGTLFFSADDGKNGLQLWRSNGIAAGTSMVANINPHEFATYPASSGSNPKNLTAVDGTLFFSADDGTNGSQLWESDGSNAGTVMVANINPHEIMPFGRANGSNPQYLTNISGTLFFAADDGIHGVQPWVVSPAAAPTIAVTSSPNPSVFGHPVTLTATVGGLNGAISGLVDFTEGTLDVTPGGVPLNASGVATATTSNLPAGTDLVVATYFGDLPGASGNDSAMPQVVTPVSTTTEDVGSSATGGSIYGQVVTYSVAVISNVPGSGTPTGKVQFLDGATILSTVSLSFGVATLKFNALTVGSHTITARYVGDGNFTASTDAASPTPLVQTVTTDNTATALTSWDSGNAVVRETVTFIATVTQRAPGTLTPRGSVVFTINGESGPAIQLSFGRATTTLFVASGSAGAKFTVTAAYTNSDGSFVNSNSTPFVELVHRDDTTTTVTSTPNAAPFFGTDETTYTATVTVNLPGSGTPAGSVEWVVDGRSAAFVALSGGKATFSTTGLTAGTHTISAAYDGDDPTGDFNASRGSQVRKINKAVPKIVLTLPQPGTTPYGGNWSAAAMVSAQTGFGAGTPTNGLVVFTATFITNADNLGHFSLGGKSTVTLGQANVDSTGKAVLSAAALRGVLLPGVVTGYTSSGQHVDLSAVTYVIKGQYTGNTNFVTSPVSAGQPELVTKTRTQTVLTGASPTPASAGQVVTLTATVQSVGGSSIAPAGTLTFKDTYMVGSLTVHRTLGTVTLPAVPRGTSVATATFTTSSLAQAAHSLTVVYNGDTSAPCPLPTQFPFRGQWVASSSPTFGLIVRPPPASVAPAPGGMVVLIMAAANTKGSTGALTDKQLSSRSPSWQAGVDQYFVTTTRKRQQARTGRNQTKPRLDEWLEAALP
jgi:ELWxxDGT repeat protein